MVKSAVRLNVSTPISYIYSFSGKTILPFENGKLLKWLMGFSTHSRKMHTKILIMFVRQNLRPCPSKGRGNQKVWAGGWGGWVLAEYRWYRFQSRPASLSGVGLQRRTQAESQLQLQLLLQLQLQLLLQLLLWSAQSSLPLLLLPFYKP